MLQSMLHFLEKSPDCFHAAAQVQALLQDAGFVPLPQDGAALAPGGRYFVPLGGASILAFRLPSSAPTGFTIAAAHSDSPCFRIRDHAELTGAYTRLSVERYGGMLPGGWLDRPLGIAGRVLVRTPTGVAARLVDLGPEQALIPSVAVHLNREAASGGKFDFAQDFFPLYSGEAGHFLKAVAQAAGCAAEDLLSSDLFLYNGQRGLLWGPEQEFLSAPRLDDLACVFAAAQGFLMAGDSSAIQVLAVFDHEEIGSETSRGAASAFFPETLLAVSQGLGLDAAAHRRLLAGSLLLSCDNGHGVHPNHPELADRNEAPVLNGGVVVKHSPRYATDGLSAAVFSEICRRAQVPVQHYSNRPDQAGGATLGNIAAARTPILAVDIGLAQLAMHACFETIGSRDVDYMIRAIRAAYETPLAVRENEIQL